MCKVKELLDGEIAPVQQAADLKTQILDLRISIQMRVQILYLRTHLYVAFWLIWALHIKYGQKRFSRTPQSENVAPYPILPLSISLPRLVFLHLSL